MAVTKHDGNGLDIKLRRTKFGLTSDKLKSVVPDYGEVIFIDNTTDQNKNYIVIGSSLGPTASTETDINKSKIQNLPVFKADTQELANQHIYYPKDTTKVIASTNGTKLINENNVQMNPETIADYVNCTYNGGKTNIQKALDTIVGFKHAGSRTIGGSAIGIDVTDSTANTKTFITGVVANNDGMDTNLKCCTKGSVNTDGIYFIPATGVLYGAAWNDFAENRKCKADFGRVVCEVGDGSLALSKKRLQGGASVVSDTCGMVIGPNEKGYKPIGVAGRVLVYIDQDYNFYKQHIGDAVCSAPGGCVSVMSREEIKEYPDRIIGYVSEIPTYDKWNDVDVMGRVWIKLR